jgi:hypothetical protein
MDVPNAQQDITAQKQTTYQSCVSQELIQTTLNFLLASLVQLDSILYMGSSNAWNAQLDSTAQTQLSFQRLVLLEHGLLLNHQLVHCVPLVTSARVVRTQLIQLILFAQEDTIVPLQVPA